MSDLEIYDSEGERVLSDTRGYSDRIADFFFGGVRLYIERKSRSTIELIAFFRARESEASRAEQYYAVYQADNHRNIFDNFSSEMKTMVEDEEGMLLQTTSEDVEVFNSLTRGRYGTPGTPTEHDHIESLLREGKQLRLGVSSSTDAVGLVKKYLDGPSQTLAIADDININKLDNCDLLVETGADVESMPIGSAEEPLDKKERKNTIYSDLESLDGPTSKKQKLMNKIIDFGQLVGVFILVFVFLLITLIVVASLTDIGVIDAFDITNFM
jgi:hypothetical protein